MLSSSSNESFERVEASKAKARPNKVRWSALRKDYVKNQLPRDWILTMYNQTDLNIILNIQSTFSKSHQGFEGIYKSCDILKLSSEEVSRSANSNSTETNNQPTTVTTQVVDPKSVGCITSLHFNDKPAMRQKQFSLGQKYLMNFKHWPPQKIILWLKASLWSSKVMA